MLRRFSRMPVRANLMGMEVAVRCDIPDRGIYHLGMIESVVVNQILEVMSIRVLLDEEDNCELARDRRVTVSWEELYDPDDVREARAEAAIGEAERGRGAMDSGSPASGSNPSVQGVGVECVEGLEVGDVLDALGWPMPVVYGSSWAADEMVHEMILRSAVVLRVYRR